MPNKKPRDTESYCAITLTPLVKLKQVVRLSCKHSFHEQAFLKYLRYKKKNCPVCRLPIAKSMLRRYDINSDDSSSSSSDSEGSLEDFIVHDGLTDSDEEYQ